MTRLVSWSLATNLHAHGWIVWIHAAQLVVMLLAHATQNGLLLTIFDRTQLLLGAMGNATTTLYRHFVATVRRTTLAGGTVGAAQSSLFDILGTSWMLARLALGSVGNAQSSLDDPIRTVGHGTLAADTLAGTTGGQLKIFHVFVVLVTLVVWCKGQAGWIAVALGSNGLKRHRRRRTQRWGAPIMGRRGMQITKKHDI